jgi:hypothetical protein
VQRVVFGSRLAEVGRPLTPVYLKDSHHLFVWLRATTKAE